MLRLLKYCKVNLTPKILWLGWKDFFKKTWLASVLWIISLLRFAHGWEGRLFLGLSKESLPGARCCPLHPPRCVLFSWATGEKQPQGQSDSVTEVGSRGSWGRGQRFSKDWKVMFLYREKKIFLVTFPFLPLCVKITHCHFANSYNIGIG